MTRSTVIFAVQDLITMGQDKLKATAGFWYFSNTGVTYFVTVNNDDAVTHQRK